MHSPAYLAVVDPLGRAADHDRCADTCSDAAADETPLVPEWRPLMHRAAHRKSALIVTSPRQR